MVKTKEKVRKKDRKNIVTGVIHISATFNNTLVSVSDLQGNIIAWSSSGCHGFKGARKSTPYAAQSVSMDACKKAMNHGLKFVSVQIRGSGMGRDASLRAIQLAGLTVTMIKDITPIPHNGCRPPKRRKV